MEIPPNDDQRKIFDEFLQELLLAAKTDEALESLFEIFLAMREEDLALGKAQKPDRGVNAELGSRCHLFKKRPDGVEWIGFVTGTGTARDILLHLAVKGSGSYFLFDECTGKVVDFCVDPH